MNCSAKKIRTKIRKTSPSTPIKKVLQKQLISSKLICIFFITLLYGPLKGQPLPYDSLSGTQLKKKKNATTIAVAAGALYGITLYGLNKTWYQEFPKTEFHFFNDNNQWKQLDKAGHFYSAFHISQASILLFNHAGMPQKKAHFWGGMMGFLILTPIEILDGFSAEYGASWGDLIANATGAGAVMAQYMFWNQARIKPKFSFVPTSLAKERPKVLGDGFHQEFIKDYNGQTYWLSLDIHAFLHKQNKFPKWLNVAFGYGVDNMIYANDLQNQLEGYDPYRQYYFGIDFDLSYFKGKSKVLNTLLYMVDLIHLPAPTLEYNRADGIRFHFLKF